MMLRPGAIVFTRSAVNRRLTDSGSERKTTSPGPEEPRAEGLAELAPPVLEEGERPEDEARRLQRLRQRDRRDGVAASAGGASELGYGGVDHPTAIVSIAGVSSSLADLNLVASGKVREMYEDGDDILMVASDRISAYDVVLPTADPRQGQGADADVGVLVRDHRPHRPQPLHLPGRSRGGRPAGPARQAAGDVPGRVRRPRLHHRLGLARVPADRLGLRDRAARRACASPTSSPSRSSPRRPRPRSATTTRTSTSTAPPR